MNSETNFARRRARYRHDLAVEIVGPTALAIVLGGFVAGGVCRWKHVGMPHEAWIVALGAVVLALMNLGGDRHFTRIVRRWRAQRRVGQERQS